jgi:hypothetical protein
MRKRQVMTPVKRKILYAIIFVVALGAVSVGLYCGLEHLRIARENRSYELSCRLRTRYLEHGISARDFCSQLMSPEVLLDRKGDQVDLGLDITGRVTLRGQTDHSGTEVAVTLRYHPRDPDRVIMAPFIVVTDPNGDFDLSTCAIQAWHVASLGVPQVSPITPCLAGINAEMATRELILYIRHEGYDSRIIVSRSFWYSRSREKLIVCALELLPSGPYEECYAAFGERHHVDNLTWQDFSPELCVPDVVREHLRECPECPLADDVMMRYLLYGRAHSSEEKLKAIDEFRELFITGSDNTGLLSEFECPVSIDASWAEALKTVEADLHRRRYRHMVRKDLAKAIREKPESIIYVARGRFTSAFDDAYLTGPSSEDEYVPDDDAIYLLCLGLTRLRTFDGASCAIDRWKVVRAVPFIIDIMSAQLADLDRWEVTGLCNVLFLLTGERHRTPEQWLEWWREKGCLTEWPADPPIDLPAKWFENWDDNAR